MRKVLFIEDEFTLQKTMKEFLREKGYEVISAFNGQTGIELCKKEKPDLILLDLILPKLDGFEVLKELKKDENTRNIPVIILTNLENENDIERGLELGATTYLTKSDQSLKDIAEKINQVLSLG